MTHLRDPARSPRRAWLPYAGVYLGYDTARCDRRVYHSEAVEEHSIVNGAPTCARCAAWAKAHLDALAEPVRPQSPDRLT